ncbi:CGNR zinc finger domain-containing protein [Nocardia panacis]|uniref:CGNR zinc finger domain-containing protein n=1 Tax=Nocardia panacis TaxID=2340916 RepID=A0A3A4KDV2_9NOCA|nr:CGNR zinc finger domain-containing protein [Nocardia panacis]
MQPPRRYLDTSRGNARRWCDMTICGNRAKSAAFRARHGD